MNRHQAITRARQIIPPLSRDHNGLWSGRFKNRRAAADYRKALMAQAVLAYLEIDPKISATVLLEQNPSWSLEQLVTQMIVLEDV